MNARNLAAKLRPATATAAPKKEVSEAERQAFMAGAETRSLEVQAVQAEPETAPAEKRAPRAKRPSEEGLRRINVGLTDEPFLKLKMYAAKHNLSLQEICSKQLAAFAKNLVL